LILATHRVFTIIILAPKKKRLFLICPVYFAAELLCDFFFCEISEMADLP